MIFFLYRLVLILAICLASGCNKTLPKQNVSIWPGYSIFQNNDIFYDSVLRAEKVIYGTANVHGAFVNWPVKSSFKMRITSYNPKYEVFSGIMEWDNNAWWGLGTIKGKVVNNTLEFQYTPHDYRDDYTHTDKIIIQPCKNGLASGRWGNKGSITLLCYDVDDDPSETTMQLLPYDKKIGDFQLIKPNGLY